MIKLLLKSVVYVLTQIPSCALHFECHIHKADAHGEGHMRSRATKRTRTSVKADTQ